MKPAALLLTVLMTAGPLLARQAEHPEGCAALAGYVTASLMQRPVGLAQGIGTLHQKVSTKSDQAQAYYDQGLAYLASYVWVEASRSFYEATRHDPDLAMAWVGLWRAYTGTDADKEAGEALAKAEALGGLTEKEKRWIALARQQQEAVAAKAKAQASRHAAYKQAIDKLIELDPEDPHAWVMRGNAEEPGAWGRGQAGGVGSIAYYEKALALDPGHIGAHHFLIHSYENIGQHATAAVHGKFYSEACPRVPHARHMYGHVLPRLGRWEEALVEFTEADRLEREYYAAESIGAEEDWHHAHNLHLLGTINLRLGHAETTSALFKEAYDLPVRDSEYAWGNAIPWLEFLLFEQRYQEALEAARALGIRKEPLNQLVAAAVEGEALLGLKQPGQARKSLKAARSDYRKLGGSRSSRAPRVATSMLRGLEGQVDLSTGDAAAASATLTKLADDIAANPRFDAWGEGLFRLQRFAREAAASGHPDVAAAIEERIQKIDPGLKAAAR